MSIRAAVAALIASLSGALPFLDQLGVAPRAALSLHQVISTALASIRVRRSSDNAEQDIGFLGRGLNVGALMAFVGSGSGFVTTFYDQTGNGKHATQATTTKQPRIVNAGVFDALLVWDGADDFMKITGLTLGGAQLGVYVNAQLSTSGSAKILVESSTAWDPAGGGGFAVYEATGWWMGASSPSLVRTNNFINSTALSQKTFLFDRTIVGSTEEQAWEEGAPLTATPSGVGEQTGTFLNNDVHIGARAGTSLFAPCRVETLVFYGDNTGASRTAIERSMAPVAYVDPDFASVVALLHCDGAAGATSLQDVSPVPKVFTAAGGAALASVGKFGGSSLRLAASGDYIATDNTSDFNWGLQDFCIEAWIRPDNVTGIKDLFQSYGASFPSGVAFQQRDAKIHMLASFNGSSWAIDGAATSSTLVAGQWTHVALTRVAGVFRLFSDGVLVYTNSANTSAVLSYASTNSVRIGMAPIAGGNQFVGYIDEVRITRGVGRYAAAFPAPVVPFGGGEVDPFWSSVRLLAHCDSPLRDAATPGRSFTPSGGAAVAASTGAYGGLALVLDGAGDFVTVPNSVDFNFGAGDFTIDVRVKPTTISGTHAILTTRAPAGSDPGFLLYQIDATLNFVCWGPAAGTTLITLAGGAMTAGAWHHVAVSRNGSSFRLFLNGVQVGATGTASAAIVDSPENLLIGVDPSNPARDFAGALEEIRFTKGVGRYAAAFTPPVVPFGSGS